MNQIKQIKLAVFFFSILVAVSTLLFSYELVVAFTHYSESQQNVFNYLRGESELSDDFTLEERNHLNDVRLVMQNVRWIFVWLVVSSILLGAYLFKKSALGHGFFWGGVAGIAGIGIIFIVQLFSFNAVFDLFHRPLFASGSWVFGADSLLIQTFPLDFFVRIAKKIFVCAIGVYLVLSGAGYFIKNSRMTKNT